MVVYSHSRLSTFENCPLQFKFRYIDKIQPDFKQSVEGFLGNQVHNVLEWVYIETKKGRIIELDEIIERFVISWKRDFNPQIRIVKRDFNEEYYFNQGIKYLINYFKDNFPFKDNTIATEKRIYLDLNSEKNYKLVGFIDRLVHHPETNLYEIHDYKTSGSLKSQGELDKDRQLALYSLGIREKFSNVKDVLLVWHFLAFSRRMVSKRTPDQLMSLKNQTIELINKIESTKTFMPKKSILCNWCQFQSNCPLKNRVNYNNSLNYY